MTFLKKILPILPSVSQWTQVLSSNTCPTLPLIRLACARIFTEIEKINKESVRCTETTLFNSQNMAIELFSLYTNLKDSFDVHLNDLYTDFDIIMIAEYLDTHTYNLVNTAQTK